MDCYLIYSVEKIYIVCVEGECRRNVLRRISVGEFTSAQMGETLALFYEN
jgi:hypothetical protein